MQGIQAFESASVFRFYVGLVSTTDIVLSSSVVKGLDEGAGISVITRIFGDFSAIG